MGFQNEYVRRLTEYYGRRLNAVGTALNDGAPNLQTLLASVDQDFDNILAARRLLIRLADQDESAWLDEAHRFGHRAGRYLALRLSPSAWRDWSETRATLCAAAEAPLARGVALTDAGLAAKAQGDVTAARSFFEEAKAIAEAAGDDEGVAQDIGNLAILDAMAGNLSSAVEGYKRQIALFERLGKNGLLGTAYNNLGMALDDLGDQEGARLAFMDADQLAENSQDVVLSAAIAGNLGGLAIDMGDMRNARRHYERQAALAAALSDQGQGTNADLGLTRIHLEEGDVPEALMRAEKALYLARTRGSGVTEGVALGLYAECLYADGRRELAIKAGRQAIALLQVHDPTQARLVETELQTWGAP